MSDLLLPHWLIVTRGDDPDDRDYTLECPGVTDRCRAYEEDLCEQGKHKPMWGDDTWFDWAGETFAHGVEHKHIDGSWMAATDRCLYVGNDHLPDAGDNLRIQPGVPLYPGRYPVYPHYDAEGYFDLEWSGAGRVQVQGDLYHGRVPDGAFYIGRQARGLRESFWHNPFKPGHPIPASYGETGLVRNIGHAVELFATKIGSRAAYLDRARQYLAGRMLACWCKPGTPCHGDWLVQAVNAPQEVTVDGRHH